MNDKFVNIGDTTRITKGDKVVTRNDIKAGDIVCVDTRGKGEPGGEVAAIAILDPKEAPTIIEEKEIIREKEKIKEKKQR